MITQWTDYSMNWSDPNPLEAKYWEAIRRAIAGRRVKAGKSLTWVEGFVTYKELQEPLFDTASFYVACNESIIDIYIKMLWDCVGSYINHTFNGGAWYEAAVTAWDKNSILTYLSASKEYNINAGELVSDAKDLLKQLYAIINLLQLIQLSNPSYAIVGRAPGAVFNFSGSGDYAQEVYYDANRDLQIYRSYIDIGSDPLYSDLVHIYDTYVHPAFLVVLGTDRNAPASINSSYSFYHQRPPTGLGFSNRMYLNKNYANKLWIDALSASCRKRFSTHSSYIYNTLLTTQINWLDANHNPLQSSLSSPGIKTLLEHAECISLEARDLDLGSFYADQITEDVANGNEPFYPTRYSEQTWYHNQSSTNELTYITYWDGVNSPDGFQFKG